MKRKNNLTQPLMEQTTLTPQEEKAYLEVIEKIVPGSAQEAQELLEGHTEETQGQ